MRVPVGPSSLAICFADLPAAIILRTLFPTSSGSSLPNTKSRFWWEEKFKELDSDQIEGGEFEFWCFETRFERNKRFRIWRLIFYFGIKIDFWFWSQNLKFWQSLILHFEYKFGRKSSENRLYTQIFLPIWDVSSRRVSGRVACSGSVGHVHTPYDQSELRQIKKTKICQKRDKMWPKLMFGTISK